jgi:prepilin-type N-terminal cleavage/methylation domain-containing protein
MKTRIHRFSFRKEGFTLVELLVSIAILSILILGLAQAMSFVSGIWIKGIGNVDNFAKARVVMNLLDRDIQMMVMRPDTAAFVDGSGNSACAFYTNVQGSPGAGITTGTPDTRAVSLVQYLLPAATPTSSTLERLNCGMNFTAATDASPAISYTSTATPPGPTSLTQLTTLAAASKLQTETLTTGVILFKYQFVDGTGAVLSPPYTPTGTVPAGVTTPTPFFYNYLAPSAPSNPRAVIVSMVVLSNSAYNLAIQTGNLSKLSDNTTLPTGAPTPNQTYSQVWNNFLDAPNTAFLSLPPAIRQGLLVFQRQIPLPTPAS